MSEKFTSNEIIVLLILVVTTFLKAIITLLTDTSQLFNKTFYDKYYPSITIFSDITFLFYFIVALYFIFIKKVRDEIFLFIFIILILKFLVYYITSIEIYIYSNDKNDNKKKLEFLEKFKHYTGIITGIFLLFVSYYVIRKVLI
jgi:hypothetical protein